MKTRRWISAWSLIACSLLAAGCISARVEAGRRVDPSLLEARLRIGESTRADVLAVLGEPSGRGKSRLSPDAGPKTVWSYFYEESVVESNELKDSRRIFLWVYLDEDRYDGYLWFSSLPK